jgi:hypothetical protein
MGSSGGDQDRWLWNWIVDTVRKRKGRNYDRNDAARFVYYCSRLAELVLSIPLLALIIVLLVAADASTIPSQTSGPQPGPPAILIAMAFFGAVNFLFVFLVVLFGAHKKITKRWVPALDVALLFALFVIACVSSGPITSLRDCAAPGLAGNGTGSANASYVAFAVMANKPILYSPGDLPAGQEASYLQITGVDPQKACVELLAVWSLNIVLVVFSLLSLVMLWVFWRRNKRGLPAVVDDPEEARFRNRNGGLHNSYRQSQRPSIDLQERWREPHAYDDAR